MKKWRWRWVRRLAGLVLLMVFAAGWWSSRPANPPVLPATPPATSPSLEAFGLPIPPVLRESAAVYAQAFAGRFGADMADGNSWLAGADPVLGPGFRSMMTTDYPDSVSADTRWQTAHLRGYSMKATVSDCVMNPWFGAENTFEAGQETVVRCIWTVTVYDLRGQVVTDRDVDPALFRQGRQAENLVLRFELNQSKWVITDDLTGRAG